MSNNNKAITNTKTLNRLEDVKHDFLRCVDILIQGGCSFNAYHDPHKKILKLTTVNSADAMKVLVPGCELKFDRHDRAYAELIIEYV